MENVIRLALASCYFSLLVLFSLTSPPGAAPDEPFHIYSGWCQESFDGPCETTTLLDGFRIIDVPERWANANCFAFHPETSANCKSNIDANSIVKVEINTDAYPQGYYSLLAVLTGNGDKPNVYEARILIALISSLIFFSILYLGKFSTATITWALPLVLISPLPMFLSSSLNPSGLAFAVGSLKLMLVITLFEQRSVNRQRLFAAMLVFISFVEIQIRRDSALLFSVACIAYVLTHRKRIQHFALGKIALASSVSISVYAAARNQQVSTVASGNLGTDSDLSFTTLIFRNLVELPDLYSRSVVGSLGWADTHLFGPAYFFPIAALGAFALLGIVFWNRERRVGLIFALVAASLIPVTIGVISNQLFSMQSIQGRYVFPLLISILVALLPYKISDHSILVRAGTFLASLFAIALVGAIWINLWRYASGLAIELSTVPSDDLWWPWSWSYSLHIAATSVFGLIFLNLFRLHLKTNLRPEIG